jgi:hypothetical protein
MALFGATDFLTSVRLATSSQTLVRFGRLAEGQLCPARARGTIVRCPGYDQPMEAKERWIGKAVPDNRG